MGWDLGYDSKWERDIGYGVPAYCDHPNCLREIDRGLSHVCGGEPYGGDRGCGLFFCGRHLFAHGRASQLCESCVKRRRRDFLATPDHPTWIRHKLNDPSWEEWRTENPGEVQEMKERIA